MNRRGEGRILQVGLIGDVASGVREAVDAALLEPVGDEDVHVLTPQLTVGGRQPFLPFPPFLPFLPFLALDG